MKRVSRVFVAVVIAMIAVTAFGQSKQSETRRPPMSAMVAPSATTPPPPNYEFFSILDGLPMLLELHRDTEVGTGRPISVYMLVIEMQIMNSDGNLEPVGLQFHNYYTAAPQDRNNDINQYNARDCKYWNKLVTNALLTRDPKSRTWPYLEFMTAEGARMVQTNEDGPVWYSDDIQCWGSSDRPGSAGCAPSPGASPRRRRRSSARPRAGTG